MPHDRYDIIARLHKIGHIHAQDLQDDGIHLHGRFPSAQSAVFAPYLVNGRPGAPALPAVP